MKRRLTLLGVVALIALAILYLENPDLLGTWFGGETDGALGRVPNPAGDEVGLEVGKAAPDFALPTLEGEVARLSDYRGQKAVIVNFWASWCGPCKVEMPDLEAVYREHEDALVVLGIDLQESPEAIRAFLEDEVAVSYPILLDGEGKVKTAYNLFTQPTSYLVDPSGIIRSRKFGAYTEQELRDRVDELLAESDERVSQTDPARSAAAPATGAEVAYAKLGEKFFGPGEIKQIGLEIDLERVPYRADLALDRLRLGCPVVDCIPSIDAPRFTDPTEADWLADDDQVIGLRRGGAAKAYPVKILNWHEIVNDTVGGEPVVVSYCPLCNSAVAFVPPLIDGQRPEFGVSGRLYNADLVMYDRASKSMWSQIEGAVIAGPLAGRSPELERIPVDLSRWGDWRGAHPDTRVLARPLTSDPQGGKPARDVGGEGRRVRDYDEDPYRHYKTNPYDTFGLEVEDRRLENKADVIGVEAGGGAKAYPRAAVVEAGLINDSIRGTPVALVHDAEADRVYAFVRPEGRELRLAGGTLTDGRAEWTPGGEPLGDGTGALEQAFHLPVFWFAWAAFHPETEVYPERNSGKAG